jgi:hypothetical protein
MESSFSGVSEEVQGANLGRYVDKVHVMWGPLSPQQGASSVVHGGTACNLGGSLLLHFSIRSRSVDKE